MRSFAADELSSWNGGPGLLSPENSIPMNGGFIIDPSGSVVPLKLGLAQLDPYSASFPLSPPHTKKEETKMPSLS